MKRFISFFLTVSLLLTLCSCLATRKIESQKQPISSQDLTHENNEITYTLEYSTDEEIWQTADQDALRLNRTMVAEPGAHNFIYFRVTTNSKLPHFFTFNFKSVNDVLGENLYGEEYYLSEAMKCCLASNSKDHTDIIYDKSEDKSVKEGLTLSISATKEKPVIFTIDVYAPETLTNKENGNSSFELFAELKKE